MPKVSLAIFFNSGKAGTITPDLIVPVETIVSTTGAFGGLLGQRVAALRMQAPRGHAGWAHARRPFTLP
jgi:hypothetical protein